MLKLATAVVEVTTKGAFPSGTVDVNCPLKLKVVPVAAFIIGDNKVGDVAKTALPVPVSSEITPANSEEVVADKTLNLSVVTTNVFEVGIVVLLILVAVATPKTGVVKVGEVDKTTLPEPVAVVTPVPPLATGSVPEKLVAVTPVNPAPLPEKLVAVNAPVLGTKDNLVLATFCGKLPEVAVTNVG